MSLGLTGAFSREENRPFFKGNDERVTAECALGNFSTAMEKTAFATWDRERKEYHFEFAIGHRVLQK